MRMSLFRNFGLKTTSNLASAFGATNPSFGETSKCGASGCGCQVKRVPTSPVLESTRCRTVCVPRTTGPNPMLSVASLSSVPRQAPETVKSTCFTPAMSMTSSSVKGCRRCSELNAIWMANVSMDLRCIMPEGAIWMPTIRSAAAAFSSEKVTGMMLRFTTLTDLEASWPMRMWARETCVCVGLATSMRILAPEPATLTLTMVTPFTSNCRVSS
mmetsp:Transcript_18595/g.40702  ORF Transcript_18595/g.40702 Transcript_18595/m.40702 type:complete len:214 (-) Transcript_18595:1590-2231(-)